jgi:hypothetical protein
MELPRATTEPLEQLGPAWTPAPFVSFLSNSGSRLVQPGRPGNFPTFSGSRRRDPTHFLETVGRFSCCCSWVPGSLDFLVLALQLHRRHPAEVPADLRCSRHSFITRASTNTYLPAALQFSFDSHGPIHVSTPIRNPSDSQTRHYPSPAPSRQPQIGAAPYTIDWTPRLASR